MKQFRFLDWDVYRDARKLFSKLLLIVEKIPQSRRYDLGSQLLRSGSSITLNIAEGSGKQSEKELNRFIETSLGSAYETLANLDILRESAHITEGEFSVLKDEISNICSQLGGLKKKLDI